VPASDVARVDEARANFRSGVALLERHQFVAADSVFATIMRQLPSAAEPYYNRGLARAARGARVLAIEDFEKYLELAPSAADRVAIRSTMTRLPDRVYGSGQALASGLIVPGLGQMNTGRPVFGVAILGGVLGATLFGLQQDTKTVQKEFIDPFGNPYTQDVTTRERPNLALAAAGAAVLWIGGAFEAMLHARATRERAEAVIRPSAIARNADARSSRVSSRWGTLLVPFLDGDPVRGVTAGISLTPSRR
jgi:hypothetical protein